MNTLGDYFINNLNDCITQKENIILGKKYRISLLTDRLVRLEYNKNGQFENRPSQRVIYRKFPKVNYTVTQSETLIQIITANYTIDYVKEQPFEGSKIAPAGNLKISLNNTDRSWNYKHPEVRNYGTITYSLDNFKGKLKLAKGLYSTDGFCCIDDSDSLVLNSNGQFISRTNKGIDIYVFMYKKDLGLCLQDYYKLTGYPQMIPRYLLGNWWYKDKKYTNNEIQSLIKKFNTEEIPLAVFMLGNKWHTENDPMSIDVNSINIPDIKKYLTKNNIKLGLDIEPNNDIKPGTNTYKMINGNTGNNKNTNFLPINNNKLNIYTSLINNLINNGIDIFNINYNNPNDKLTLALLNHYHYTTEETELNKRSVVLTRNHNIAIHRYGIITTGKTNVDWETLAILPKYNASASNMGISYIANAIGGYQGGIEDFELFIRYIQFGVFSPLLILASDDGKYYRREPWRWNLSQKEIIKKYLQLRNKLIPYLYTEAYIYHKTGSPIVQPLYYKYPKIYDEPLYSNQYFFGQSILVCPITKKKNIIMNRVVQKVFIPDGTWYELESGKKFPGNKYYMNFYKDEDYPVFCKEGSIIVKSLDTNTTNPENLEIDIFPGTNGEYKLYEDDGITNNFKNGNYAITEYTFNYEKEIYEFIINPVSCQGLVPDIRSYKIRFRNTNSANITVSNGTNNITASAIIENNDLIIEIPKISSGEKIIITCTGQNLENSTIKLINDDIKGILEDLEIKTILKEEIDKILFGDLPIRKKRIAIRKLKRKGLEVKFMRMFLNLLEYINTV